MPRASPSTPAITREQALAHRLAAHHLHERAPPGAWASVGAIGMTDTPPGNALLGFAARMEGVTPETLDELLATRALVNTWSLRISPRIVPATDLAPFTTGLLPHDEKGVKAVLGPHEKEITRGGLSLVDALRVTEEAMAAALAAGPLGKGDLSAAVTERVPKGVLIWCRGCETHHVPESLFRLAARYGRIVIAPRAGKEAVLQLLPRAPTGARETAAADLARRYLHAYGPSTPKDFADWAGVSRDQATEAWESLGDEPVEVDFGGARAFVLRDDLQAFAPAGLPEGVRLLPPHDAYLEQRDRATLVPDRELQKEIWKVVGNPGTLLVNGEVAGTWRATKTAKSLAVEVTPFGRLPAGARDALRAEAGRLAHLRGCVGADVSTGTPA